MKKKFYLLLLTLALSLPTMAETEKIMLQGSVGKLSAIIQKPVLKKNENCPMVILLHGFMGNKDGGLEKTMSDELEKAGIATIRFDFNGHGESEGEFQNMTVPNEIEDAKMVFNYVRSLPYVDSHAIAISGHSQGGVVASMLAGELGNKKITGVVLMAPATVLRDDAIRGMTMGSSYNPLNPPEYVELFGRIKLGREFIRTAFSLPIYETAARYKGPACIIHGTGDRTVPYTYGERYHYIWNKSELYILKGYDHLFAPDMKKAINIALSFLIELFDKK